jgi:CheY-like chemotaxis protein
MAREGKMFCVGSTNGAPKHGHREGMFNKKLTAPCVLLVDDDPVVRALMATSLEDFGCKTITAGNGEEALQILHTRSSIDLIVAEVTMPVMGGLELLRVVRQTDDLKQLPVILCSTAIDETALKQSVKYRCGRYLLKPVSAEFLFDQISSLLKIEALRRAAEC